jgi:hypothetical protein
VSWYACVCSCQLYPWRKVIPPVVDEKQLTKPQFWGGYTGSSWKRWMFTIPVLWLFTYLLRWNCASSLKKVLLNTTSQFSSMNTQNHWQ